MGIALHGYCMGILHGYIAWVLHGYCMGTFWFGLNLIWLGLVWFVISLFSHPVDVDVRQQVCSETGLEDPVLAPMSVLWFSSAVISKDND
jgi:hypothetical protein